jgi:hypothetical protein
MVIIIVALESDPGSENVVDQACRLERISLDSADESKLIESWELVKGLVVAASPEKSSTRLVYEEYVDMSDDESDGVSVAFSILTENAFRDRVPSVGFVFEVDRADSSSLEAEDNTAAGVNGYEEELRAIDISGRLLMAVNGASTKKERS